MDNVIGIPSTKKTFYRFTVLIRYADETTESVECTFFGSSVDQPNFMLFSNAHPDASEDEADVPDLMVNSDTVKSIRIVEIKKVDR